MMHSHQTNSQDRQIKIWERIAIALERMAPPAKVPNYRFPLEAFKAFDWESIGAFVEQVDRQGPSVVNWEGIRFNRCDPGNRHRDSIWFGRCAGNDERGAPIYQRLITFRSPGDVGPVPERVRLVQTNGAIDNI